MRGVEQPSELDQVARARAPRPPPRRARSRRSRGSARRASGSGRRRAVRRADLAQARDARAARRRLRTRRAARCSREAALRVALAGVERHQLEARRARVRSSAVRACGSRSAARGRARRTATRAGRAARCCAPAHSFSIREQIRASVQRDRDARLLQLDQGQASATSSAAEEDRPAPRGTLPVDLEPRAAHGHARALQLGDRAAHERPPAGAPASGQRAGSCRARSRSAARASICRSAVAAAPAPSRRRRSANGSARPSL